MLTQAYPPPPCQSHDADLATLLVTLTLVTLTLVTLTLVTFPLFPLPVVTWPLTFLLYIDP
ncbi:hypothetical protein GCM10027040_35100 [Halomonas shantousis]